MVYQERNTWVQLIVSAIGMGVYVIVILALAEGGRLTDVAWWPVMLWTVGASIVASIVLSILWGIVAGARDPDGVGRSDIRDRDIAAGIADLDICRIVSGRDPDLLACGGHDPCSRRVGVLCGRFPEGQEQDERDE